ncbi:hypothetical protein HUN08_00910 [Gordonia sp. X0973]|uniref:hypothetical protein n=1 Tax=Gordonia sp. X0973 TaxID=2742602 RepID=UPI000F53C3C8|nr:hypothetical protein [Gordonia sp. X0973]QKT05912.1 hypothetical protein HUN08_00910 [Gordonia sp. X0973]
MPQSQFEVITFEVKTMANLNVIAVYEAMGHRRASTHCYVLLELRDVVAKAEEPMVRRVANAAREHGVGVITFDDPGDFDTWDEVVPARRTETPPEALNRFIQDQVSGEGRLELSAGLAGLATG